MQAGTYWVRTSDMSITDEMVPACVVYNNEWAINPKVWVLGYDNPFALDDTATWEWGPELMRPNTCRLPEGKDVAHAQEFIRELGSVTLHGPVPASTVHALWHSAAMLSCQYDVMKVRAEAAEAAIEAALQQPGDIQDVFGSLRRDDAEEADED